MKKFLLVISFLSIYVSSFSQFSINGDLVTTTNFKGSPVIGLSGIFLSDLNNGLAAGGLLGLQFSTASGATSFRIPIMAEARYFVSGETDGFYPVANLGFIHREYKINGVTTISSSYTNFAFGLGVGVKFGNTDISFRYENILLTIGHAEDFNFKLGFWMGGQSGGRGHRRR